MKDLALLLKIVSGILKASILENYDHLEAQSLELARLGPNFLLVYLNVTLVALIVRRLCSNLNTHNLKNVLEIIVTILTGN